MMSLMPVVAWGTGERLVYKFFKDIQDNEIRTGIDMAKCYSYFRAERNPVLPIYIYNSHDCSLFYNSVSEL